MESNSKRVLIRTARPRSNMGSSFASSVPVISTSDIERISRLLHFLPPGLKCSPIRRSRWDRKTGLPASVPASDHHFSDPQKESSPPNFNCSPVTPRRKVWRSIGIWLWQMFPANVLLGIEGLHGADVNHSGEIRRRQLSQGFGLVLFGSVHHRFFHTIEGFDHQLRYYRQPASSESAEIRLSSDISVTKRYGFPFESAYMAGRDDAGVASEPHRARQLLGEEMGLRRRRVARV
jgi:hypothetical protein